MTGTPENERTRVIAGSALNFMERHDIPATPDNYALWYLYATGDNSQLNAEVNALIARKEAFTSYLLDDLRLRFVPTEQASELVSDAGAKVETQLAKLLGIVTDSARDTAAYGQILNDAAGGLKAPQGDARGIIQILVRATQDAQARNQALETSLKTSASEVTELRETLARTRRDAMTDPLTGLANRKAFDEALAAMSQTARHENADLTLLFGDVDHFKKFNDSFGHQLGDQVLRLVARCINDNLPKGGLGARYGGEEFAVLLPETPLKTAAVIANNIRRAVESKKVVRRGTGEQLSKITISIGCARYQPGEATKKTIERADEALYAAKRDGRNLVRLESDLATGAGAKSKSEIGR